MTNKPEYPAFPCAGYSQDCGTMFQPGMTLRDWFAGMACQGMLSNGIHEATGHVAASEYGDMRIGQGIAALAYDMADAMIEARGICNDF